MHCNNYEKHYSRRKFLTRTSLGLGAAALASIVNPASLAAAQPAMTGPDLGALGGMHVPPRVKRVIYLFQSGGPSQLELYDYKSELVKRHREELPASIRGEQRLTGMSAGQRSWPLAKPHYDFSQHGQSGAWVSELLPHIGGISDKLCFVKSMYTEAINHDPAITFFQTGSQHRGRPSIGSWISYGLGSENEDLPSFCVLLSEGRRGGQPLYAHLWGSGFLTSQHQGIQFRSGKDPVLYLSNPAGMTDGDRKRQLDYLKELQQIQYEQVEDPEIQSKIAQYEMAYRMQTSVPETMDLTAEPDHVFDLYGEDSRTPGTFAANCLLARRLAEKGVKFIQLYHQGWDQHGNLPKDIATMAKSVDQPSAALVKDLEQRGMLEDTLVIWGGEFGRTNYSQGQLTDENFGRDHHPGCFSIWMAGGGVKPGISYGRTDDFGYNIVENPVHVHDFQATLLHLLGIDHEKFTYKFQGRRFRLTDVHGKVVKGILA
ncbi:MAG: DUF1501 domain-containing protein [Rhodothermales bacterium]